MVALDGKPLQDSRQMLLAASARTENTAMDWNVDRTSLDNDGWGRPPTLSEAVPLDLTVPGKKVQAWRVTPLGQRGEALPMQENVLRLRDQHQTLWVLLTRP